MNTVTDLTEVGMKSLTTLGQSLMAAIPNIVGAILLLLLGWAIARITSFVVKKTLKAIKFDKLAEKLNLDDLFGSMQITVQPSHVVGRFVYWVIMLLFLVTASDTLGWAMVSESISGLIIYLPRLFSGIVIFVVGFYIASFIKKGLRGILESISISSARLLSSFAFYIVVIIVTLTALNQAGVDTEIITSNVILFVGGIILAFAVSFGIGSRDIISNILSSFYSKNNFAVGQKIEMGDVSGTIQKIDMTSCLVKTEDATIVIPVKRLLAENVVIKDQTFGNV